MNKYSDKWIDGPMNRLMKRQKDRRKNMWTQREMDKHTIGRTKRQEGIWMGVWTYRQTDRVQTYR